ncbi:MAG: HlyD family efflux transporter periplasmic adaptor subunit [Alphaproteobacteria bacterium]|nr:HlyD family efflux transporter periplasmic adaptor subunit [Alphaproteobacteria bacterium]
MKRSLLLGLLVAALLGGCGDGGHGTVQGYVEGEPLLVGPKSGGQVSRLAVDSGDAVKQGDLLFILDADTVLARREQAKARLAQAKAQLENLLKGKRPEEIAVVDAQVREAEARLAVAKQDFERAKTLLANRVVSQKAYDNAKGDLDVAEAEVQRLKRERRTAQMPARSDEIEAAKGEVAAAQGALAEAETAVRERSVFAPRAGVIQDVYFREGEVVGEGRPVVSLLPPDNRKVLFFVPEARLARVKRGETVGIGCDGCPSGLDARVTFVSNQAEFTPPVIFSVQTRDKLVYKVEAVPEGDRRALKPGQPVDVTLP